MIVSLEDMKEFLGENETNSNGAITSMISSAEQELKIATGIDTSSETVKLNEIAKRAIKIMVWLSFFADRDANKNTQYLISERTRLIQMLKWGEDTAQT